MSRNIDHRAKFNKLLEVNFKTYDEYIEAAEYLGGVHIPPEIPNIIKIIKLDGFNSEHFKANYKFHHRYRLGINLRPQKILEIIKLLDNHDLLYLLDHEDQYEETKINLDNYKTLKNLGDLI